MNEAPGEQARTFPKKPQWDCLTFSDLFASKQKVTAKRTDAGVTASVHYFQGVSLQGVHWHQKGPMSHRRSRLKSKQWCL